MVLLYSPSCCSCNVRKSLLSLSVFLLLRGAAVFRFPSFSFLGRFVREGEMFLSRLRNFIFPLYLRFFSFALFLYVLFLIVVRVSDLLSNLFSFHF